MADIDSARVAQAWSMRTHEGLSYREVAKRLGVSNSTAHAWVAMATDACEDTGRHGQVIRDVATVDALLARGEAEHEDGDLSWPNYVRGALGLLGHRARLLGLYAPVRVSVGDERRAPDPALRAALEREAAAAEAADQDDSTRELEAAR